MGDNPLRSLPAVHEVLQSDVLRALADAHPPPMITTAVRAELQGLRERLRRGALSDGLAVEAIAHRVAERLREASRPRLRSVINATGVVLHTNLGRSPLAEEAARAAYDAARGYLNLELDLESGKRSSRQNAIRDDLCRLTGAESATAVNNNAAATILALRALCQGKEVIVSRGQLIEIGGSFRIPEIMAVSGAILREVGTTNITRLGDFERAVHSGTGALMQIHPSNYRVRGFTRSVPLADLVALGRKHQLPVIDDVGSGALTDLTRLGLSGEPLARESIAAGADLVLFSGDKLLGGPQAGLLVGQRTLIQAIEKDPLMRAFRLDKMTLAALAATLRLYGDEEQALRRVPVLTMLATPPGVLRRRCEAMAGRLRALPELGEVHVREDEAFVGGGSLPDQALPTWVLQIRAPGLSDEQLASRLRLGEPAVLGRLHEGHLLLDLRTVFAEQEDALFGRICAAVQTPLDGP